MNPGHPINTAETYSGIAARRGSLLRQGWLRVLLAALMLTSASPTQAQSVQDQLRSMQAQIEELQQEVKSLKEELHGKGREARSEAAPPTPAPTPEAPAIANLSAQPAPPAGEETTQANLAMVQAQVAEQAQTKVESNSRMPVKIFGTIVSDTFYNTGNANWLDTPTTALPPAGAMPQTGSISSSLRQSRIGLMIDGPMIGSLKSSGFLAVDFFGGSTAFATSSVFGLPRILYGYIRLENSRTAIEFGQDQMILAPLDPTSLAALAFPDLYESGNLYLRAPQVRVEEKLVQSPRGSLTLDLGMLAPVGSYPTPSITYTGGAEPWRKPAVQGRLGWRSSNSSLGEGKGFAVGASGHYGKAQYGVNTAASWANAVDFDSHVGRFGFAAEGFRGQNLEAMGGGIGQPGKSLGGFFECRLKATQRLQFNAGLGTNQIIEQYNGLATIQKNSGLFANSIFQFTPELSMSLEYRPVETALFGGQMMHNNHFDFVAAYSF